MRLPPEVLYTTAVEYLDCQTVVSLSMTCRDLHTLLNTSQTLWKSLTYRKTGINYIHQGGTWRQACFDPEFHELCPHLSSLTFDHVLADRIQRFHQVLESQPFEEIECTISNCEIKTPDLWMCLTKGCDHVGCGRTKNQHAIDHFLSSNHPLCVKINTLEFWCYKCTKWMGKQNLYPAETQLTERIISSFLKPNTYPYQFLKTHFAAWNKRRYIERGMYKIVESDKLYFLSRDFLMRWREFLLSNQGPPECIDNWSLVGNADAVREHGRGCRDEPQCCSTSRFWYYF
ncbi:hypothetical protein BDR26DRAFT_689062 [Obelidium mucronatum]|nr:hypothetical protein BDR26DRAFT_689062 [Obelidium mucronatum]